MLRLRLNTGPTYELLAKYGANTVRIEAWPDADSCVTEGKEELVTDPALHEGAQDGVDETHCEAPAPEEVPVRTIKPSSMPQDYWMWSC